jgi:hypothetical protein
VHQGIAPSIGQYTYTVTPRYDDASPLIRDQYLDDSVPTRVFGG